MEEDKENVLEPQVITKYQTAGDLVQKTLTRLITLVKPAAKVQSVIEEGTTLLSNLSQKVYNNKSIKKGIAFPVCVSVNDIVCHFNPIEGDPDYDLELKDGDIVRIELGAHVDGYIAQTAHTLTVGKPKEDQVKVMQACQLAQEIVLRTLKPGKTNYEISKLMDKVAETCGVKPVQGMLSTQLLRNVLDGPNKIITNPSEEQRKQISEVTFEQGQVFYGNLGLYSRFNVYYWRCSYQTISEENYHLCSKCRCCLPTENEECSVFVFSNR